MFNILREAKKKLRFYSERKVITGGEPIVFFSPDAYLSPHFSIQCIIAKVLQDAGEQVVVLRCNAYLPFCPMFPDPLISKISGKERMVCRACSSNSFRMTDQYGLRGMDLGPSFSSDIKSEVNQAIEGAPHNLFDFEYDGWKFGYLGSEHFTLNLKISDFEKFGREHRKVWLRYVNTSLLIYLGLKQVLKKLDCKTLVFYNESFPQLSARLAAMKLGIHVVELTHPPHKNVDRQRPVIMNTDVATYLMKPGELWSEHRNLALPPEIIKSIGEDLFTRFHAKGVFNYSPAKKRRQYIVSRHWD